MYHGRMDDLDTRGIQAALDNLVASGLQVRSVPRDDESPTRDPTAPTTIDLGWNNRWETFSVRAKKGLRPATAGMLFHDLTKTSNTLLFSDRIASSLADLARNIGVNYVDETGNAWIATPSFLIDIRGRANSVARASSSFNKVSFTKAEMRAVLSLVVQLDLAAPPRLTAREVGSMAQVSHGSANSALQKLRQLGYLSDRGLRRDSALLDQWTNSYLMRGGLHKTSRTVFINPAVAWAEELNSLDGFVSGEAAAETRGWPIRASSALIYTDGISDVTRHLRTRSVGPGMSLEIRTPSITMLETGTHQAASAMLTLAMLKVRAWRDRKAWTRRCTGPRAPAICDGFQAI